MGKFVDGFSGREWQRTFFIFSASRSYSSNTSCSRGERSSAVEVRAEEVEVGSVGSIVDDLAYACLT